MDRLGLRDGRNRKASQPHPLLIIILSMEIWRAKEVARYLRINEKMVYRLVREGTLPHLKLGGKIVFPKELIDRWIVESAEEERSIYIAGSDDPLLRLIIDAYNREAADSVVFYAPVGSIKGLKMLSKRKAKLACCHIFDLERKDYTASYVERYLGSEQYVVVELFERKQGLYVQRGNPKGIRSLKDLTLGNVSFVNRNEGSGTRLLFDFLLMEEGVEADLVAGYRREVDSHLQAGVFVLKGYADCAFGIEYVASLLELEFLPFFSERFDIVIPKDLYGKPHVRDLLSLFEQGKISSICKDLSGYDITRSGRLIRG